MPYGIHCPKNQLNKASTCTLLDVGQTSTYHTFLHKAVNNAICNLTSTMHSCMHAYPVYVHLFITPLQLFLNRQRPLFVFTSIWHHACKDGCGALQRKGQVMTCACAQAKQTLGSARCLESVVYHHTCHPNAVICPSVHVTWCICDCTLGHIYRCTHTITMTHYCLIKRMMHVPWRCW